MAKGEGSVARLSKEVGGSTHRPQSGRCIHYHKHKRDCEGNSRRTRTGAWHAQATGSPLVCDHSGPFPAKAFPCRFLGRMFLRLNNGTPDELCVGTFSLCWPRYGAVGGTTGTPRRQKWLKLPTRPNEHFVSPSRSLLVLHISMGW